MRILVATACLCAAFTSTAWGQMAQARAMLTSEQAREERAYATGIQALLWGRPLTEYLHTTHDGAKAQASYLNYFRKYSALKTAADRFVNTPNNVSIDAYCLADLTSEPVVVNAPAPQQPRYYIVQVGDAYDEIVHNIGGASGPAPGLYLVTGPDYHGPIPATMKQIRVRTKYASVAARVFVKGDADLSGAIEVQKGIHVLPLSVFQQGGLKYEIPKQDYAARLEFKPQGSESLREYEKLGFAMKTYLSAGDDQSDPIIVSFRRIGLSVKSGFDAQKLDEPTKRGLARAIPAAQAIIDDAYAHSAELVNGWRVTMLGGRAGGDFAVRAGDEWQTDAGVCAEIR